MSSKPSNVIKIISGSRGKFPIKLGISAGQLAVTIYLHEENSVAGKLACWSYLTEGLVNHNQKECLLTLRINANEDPNKFPMQPLQFFSYLLKHAQQKKTVDIGDAIKLGEKGLFGFVGMAFTYALNNPTQTPLRRPTLSCLLLTEAELLNAQQHGLSRVIARLGYEQDHFPCIPWNNRERPSLSLNNVTQLTTLNRAPKIPMKHTAVYMEDGETVVLNIPKRMRSYLLKAAEGVKGDSLYLLTQIFPGNDGCMTWLPHKDSSQIVSAENSAGEAIAGCFLLFHKSADFNGASMLEDGFAMNVTATTWQALRSAMAAGQNMAIPGDKGNMSFQLLCSDKTTDLEKPFPRIHPAVDDTDEGQGLLGRWLGKFKK